MENKRAFPVLVLALTLLQSSAAVVLKAANNAPGSPGGNRFDSQIGLQYGLQTLSSATSFIWSTFRQSGSDIKNVESILLTIESYNGVAYTSGDVIHMSAEYIANYGGDVKFEFTGVMYHETTHVWQWNGRGQAPSGLIEGVADYVRLKAGYAPGHWVRPGGGQRWDQGYDVTARFLDYCEGKRGGFVAELNRKMRDGYSNGFFVDLLGKSVDDLWREYKAAYGGYLSLVSV